MNNILCFLFATSLLLAASWDTNATTYFPPKHQWKEVSPDNLGLDSAALQRAVDFAVNNEYSGNRDLRIAILDGFRAEPFHEVLGPTKKRGGPAGLILKDGYIVAKWGDVSRVDMTFSVTKSYLSSIAGIAVDNGLIDSVDDRVENYVWDGTFAGEHNQRVTWHTLLNQSSDWSGELFGIKDWADRPPNTGGLDDWRYRELHPPGSVMEYNDVRVNVLAYSLLHVWRSPLPKVMKKYLMDPIDASTTWRWFGYEDAWVTLDGQQMKSVTGGGHSGGGVFISTYDQARFGLLIARNGQWKDQQLLSKDWLSKALSSSPANQSYGYMWWLNKGPRQWKEIKDTSIFYAAGFGGNFIVIDQQRDLVIVTRWLEPNTIGKFVAQVMAAMPAS